MLSLILTIVVFASVAKCQMLTAMPPSPVKVRMNEEPDWVTTDDYLELPSKDIDSRDHGCVEVPAGMMKMHYCADIWIKNKYSAAGVAPTVVTLDFHYNNELVRDKAWTPYTTWLEYVSPWKIRGCVATHERDGGALDTGKITWLAVYDHPQTSLEQSGVLPLTSTTLTAGKMCIYVNFPRAFQFDPKLKLTLKVQNGYHSVNEAMIVWSKGLTRSGTSICFKEMFIFSGYHYDYEIHWYGVAELPTEDNASYLDEVRFPAGDSFPTEAANLNYFYCKNVSLPYKYHPCASAMVQVSEPSVNVFETPMVGWISYWNNKLMTVCYADQRGLTSVRKTEVVVSYIIYGTRDMCEDYACPDNKECMHTSVGTVECGCWKECPMDDEPACGTNMKTYMNKCHLEKMACENNNNFSFAHLGKCNEMTMGHGREQLDVTAPNGGLYCKLISTGNTVWYPDAEIHVQISVSWMNAMDAPVHAATASWVQKITPNSFEACIMEANRREVTNTPYINWFAYQGIMENVMSARIEVGEWMSGTHCVPLHERTILEPSMKWHPNDCPHVDITDNDKVDQDKWQYDSHLMSQIYGNHHHEWFKRMLSGYGVEKLNLTNGMSINNVTIMMTIEHTDEKMMDAQYQNAMNVWLEYNNSTEEAYICMREMMNFAGKHQGVYVHWTLFNGSEVPNIGFSHEIYFKPQALAPMLNNYAFCQTERYIPEDMDLADGATVLLSLHHKIPMGAVYESMRKYKKHQDEVNSGMSLGDRSTDHKNVVESWMMPHMWRANLTGWRPHMSIARNTDYSAWVESRNNTHIKVCQKSIFSGFHYEGVTVSILVLPDRCPTGFHLLKNYVCMKLEDCTTHSQSAQVCGNQNAFVGAPEDIVDHTFISYLANQQPASGAISDIANEGDWVRDLGNPSPSHYFRWAENEPPTDTSKNCILLGGRETDFTMTTASCNDCLTYTCVMGGPQLSCSFPSNYCGNNGKCKDTGMFTHECECIPPYYGQRCNLKF